MHINKKHEDHSYKISRLRSPLAQWRSIKDINHPHENVSRNIRLSSHRFWMGQVFLSLKRRHCWESQLSFGQDKDQKHVNQSDQKGNIWNRYEKHDWNINFSQVRSHGRVPRYRVSDSNQNVHERYWTGPFIREHP